MRPFFLLVLSFLTLVGCNLTRATTNTIAITPETEPVAVTDWQTIAPGIEERTMEMARDGGSIAPVILLRIDPAWVTFQVHYTAGVARSISEWRTYLPDAQAIINGGFFDENDRATGLTISNGQVFGQSYQGFGGMFQVEATGQVRVRSLVSEPYAGETLAQAVQAFPVLVEAGGVRAPQDDGFDEGSRRSFIAQDSAGHILLGVVPYSFVSLAELQLWLLSSGLDIQIAFGLDGTRSACMVINVPGNMATYASFDRIPTVIAVYPR